MRGRAGARHLSCVTLAGPVSPSEGGSPVTRPLIAVVNDDTTFLHLMDELLGEENYDTILWVEGRTAYEMIRDRQPQLVILDIRAGAPERGWQTLEVIRLDPRTRAIPVIICSADSESLRANTDRLLRLNCTPLEKPFDIDELLERVRGAVGPPPPAA